MLGAAFVMQSAMDNSAMKVAETLASIAESTSELAKAAPAAAAAPSRAAARGGRPDPSKVYKIAVGDAPTKGPKNAAITIVEYSDFQ